MHSVAPVGHSLNVSSLLDCSQWPGLAVTEDEIISSSRNVLGELITKMHMLQIIAGHPARKKHNEALEYGVKVLTGLSWPKQAGRLQYVIWKKIH
jgi:hypothetical protein